jgi:hypothetical protein
VWDGIKTTAGSEKIPGRGDGADLVRAKGQRAPALTKVEDLMNPPAPSAREHGRDAGFLGAVEFIPGDKINLCLSDIFERRPRGKGPTDRDSIRKDGRTGILTTKVGKEGMRFHVEKSVPADRMTTAGATIRYGTLCMSGGKIGKVTS